MIKFVILQVQYFLKNNFIIISNKEFLVVVQCNSQWFILKLHHDLSTYCRKVCVN